MRSLILATMVLVSFSAVVRAGNDENALRERLRARHGQLQELKRAGKVGETAAGYVEAVKSEFREQTAGIVDAENADRRKVYQIIADREKTSPALVGERNAQRKFARAEKGEYFKGKDGRWKQK